MKIQFSNAADLSASTLQLEKYFKNMHQSLYSMGREVEREIRQLYSLLNRTPLQTKRVTAHPEKMKKKSLELNQDKVNSILSEIDSVVRQGEQKLSEITKQKVREPARDRERDRQKQPVVTKATEAKRTGSSKKVKEPILGPPVPLPTRQKDLRPPVYNPAPKPKVVKRGEIPEPPQRIRRGNFAPLIKASIQRPREPTVPSSKQSLRTVTSLQPQSASRQIKTNYHFKEAKTGALPAQPIAAKQAKLELRPTFPQPRSIIQSKPVARQRAQKKLLTDAFFVQELRSGFQKTSKRAVVQLADYDRQCMGYNQRQIQARKVFLRKLSQHFRAAPGHSMPEGSRSQLHALLFRTDRAISKLNRGQGTKVSLRNSLVAKYVLQMYGYLESLPLQGGQPLSIQQGAGSRLAAQVRSKQIIVRALPSSTPISVEFLAARLEEAELALLRFYVLPGLRRKTDQSNLLHVKALLQLARMSVLPSSRRLALFYMPELQSYFG